MQAARPIVPEFHRERRDVDLPEALALLGRSDLAPAVTDRVIALDELVPEGIEPLAAGTARGKIVVAP